MTDRPTPPAAAHAVTPAGVSAPTPAPAPAHGARFGAAAPHAPSTHPAWSLPCLAVVAWSAGIVLALAWPRVEPWGAAGGLCAVVAALCLARRRLRGARLWCLVALIFLGAAWAALDRAYVAPDDLRRWMAGRAQLSQVTGRVDGPTRPAPPPQGTLGRYSYREPGTLLTLDVDSIRVGDDQTLDPPQADAPATPAPASAPGSASPAGLFLPARGKLIVRIRPVDERPRPGERIRVTGWLSTPAAPGNPGEFDARSILADAGIVGRLNVRDRAGWQSLDPPGKVGRLRALADDFARLCSDSLRLGMSPVPARHALLDALLLGLRNEELTGLDDAFRRVGLAHVLAISGAHLSVLLGLVWFLSRLLRLHPRVAPVGVFAVLAIYMLIVPPQVPIIRSAIMAGAFCLAHMLGRRVRGIDALAFAALLILIWRPGDLFNAGFQLSFGIVAAMILYARPCARRMLPISIAFAPRQTRRVWLLRLGADALAANIVAAAFAFPLVAFHFGTVNPLGLLVSLPALPLVSLVMSLGFLKMVAGLAFPSLGLLLAWPLDGLTHALASIVEVSADLPGASVALIAPPSPLWAGAVIALLVALGAGWLARRTLPALACVLLCLAWLAGPDVGHALYERGLTPRSPPPMRLDSFAVGDGSCFLLRLNRRGEYFTLMFDCGSLETLDIAPRAIVPALGTMGLRRIDALFISHADLDHFCGSLDLADRIAVGRVLTTRYVLEAARARPNSAVGALIEGMRRRGVPIEEVGRGWHEEHAGASMDLIWPPPDLVSPRSNDTSLVLSTRVAGRRVLLNGDIQQAAMTGLFAAGEPLAADVTDLPHHGSFVEASPRWYAAVAPSVVLQSTGPLRLHPDKWAGTIDPARVTRLITDERGMVSVRVETDGTMTTAALRPVGTRR